MFAATAAGIYHSVEEAMEKMGQGFSAIYYPDKQRNRIYEERYKRYLAMAKEKQPTHEKISAVQF